MVQRIPVVLLAIVVAVPRFFAHLAVRFVLSVVTTESKAVGADAGDRNFVCNHCVGFRRQNYLCSLDILVRHDVSSLS